MCIGVGWWWKKAVCKSVQEATRKTSDVKTNIFFRPRRFTVAGIFLLLTTCCAKTYVTFLQENVSVVSLLLQDLAILLKEIFLHPLMDTMRLILCLMISQSNLLILSTVWSDHGYCYHLLIIILNQESHSKITG